MESRNFRTSMLGGFRKKDVIAFLTEEKMQHEQELQQQMEESSAQVRELMEQRDEAQINCQALLRQMEESSAQVRELMEQRDEAQINCQALLQQMEAERVSHAGEIQALRLKVQELESRPAPEPVLQVNGAELESLREALAAERERVQALDARLHRQPGHSDSQEHLWALCGKMERTLRQMERMLDGPLRMTCYPEPMEEREPEEAPAFEKPAAPVETAAPADLRERSSVSSLLKKIRHCD